MKQENSLLIMALLLVVYTCLFLRSVVKPPTCAHCLEGYIEGPNLLH